MFVFETGLNTTEKPKLSWDPRQLEMTIRFCHHFENSKTINKYIYIFILIRNNVVLFNILRLSDILSVF